MRARPVVHQFTAVLAGRDAVGRHTAEVDAVLRAMGCETRTFAAHVNPDAGISAEDFRSHSRYPSPDLMLYQMSTGSPVGEYLLTRPEPLLLDYHNITPAEDFSPWEPHVGVELYRARRQLARLARRARAAVADSEFNATELRLLGLDDVAVAPIIWRPPQRRRSNSAQPPTAPTVLFVGRVAPNKRHEDLIGAVALLRRDVPDARLVLIGATASSGYERALRSLADRLGLVGAVEFAGSVHEAVLDEHYRTAAVYASASTHEGFCVPLIEAMSAGLPVVARAAAAVPETVGEGALLFDGAGPLPLAEALRRVLNNAALRACLIAAGQRRAQAFDPDTARERMRAALARHLAAL